MDECLGSIDFNENSDLILSSSYLTYQHWIGFIGFLGKSDLNEFTAKRKSVLLSSLKTGKSMTSGVSQAKWVTNDRFLTGTDNGEVMLYKLNKEPENLYENVMLKQEHDSMVLCVVTNFNSEIALTGSDDSKIKVWNLKEELSIKTLKGHDSAVCSISMNPTCNQVFLSCSEDNRALIWDTRKENPACLIPHQFKGFPSASAWSRVDTNLIAMGSENGQLGIFDTRNMCASGSLALTKSSERLIRCVKFNSNCNLIATASEDCKTAVYKFNYSSVVNEANFEKIYENNEHNDYVTDLAWNPQNSNEYLSSSWDGTILKHLVS